ncbi:MAG TPA: tetratricopeptide repeat protein [Verrucomicrobiae bacterium]|nr:tetratricopeptide repeat protein [Verrucomicrobiae bacterium]
MNADHSDGDPARSSRRAPSGTVALSLAFVSIISMWVFYPVLANGFVQWDDHIYLAELMRMGRYSWPSMRWMWTSLQPFYLQPIAWMTHLADYQVWGLNATGHHLTNLLLHGVYVALVGTLVWLLTAKVANISPAERLAMSVVVALVCGIHPLQVESVAWVAARNGLLCSLWMVATLCAYVRATRDDGRMKRSWWRMTIALNAVALLTKPFAVSLPVLMLALDYFPLRRYETGPTPDPSQEGNTQPDIPSPLFGRGEGRGEGSFGTAFFVKRFTRLVAEKWPMIGLSALASVGAIGARVQMQELAQDPLGTRLLVAARGAVFYLWKLVWPAWLSPYYPLGDGASLRSEEFLVPVLFCVAVTIVAVWARKRAPVLIVAWVSYLAVLLPVCGLVQVGGQAVADRYAYLSMVPALVALGSGILWIWRRGSALFKAAICIGLGAWLALIGLWTRGQMAVWHDDVSLWSAALEHFPDDPRANYNLGGVLLERHRFDEARVAVERAIAHSDPHAVQLPMAHGTLGTIYLKLHEYDKAMEQLRQAIAADETLWASRYYLACAYARTGRLAEAYDMLRALLAAQPQYAALAARDGELTALRDDPAYQSRFAALVGAGRN